LTVVLRLFCVVLFLAAPGLALGEPASFDLDGPKLDVTVTDAGKTLPISEVPNLVAGEQLSIKADFPPDQSARYLLVLAFLRGATNPPAKTWFYKSPTWSPKNREGLRITIPAGAQQALVFLAPETGGDFKTLVDAVRGRPGAFVRASQELNQATLDRSRLDAFLTAIRTIDQSDPDRLKTASPVLARSLAIKLDTACLAKVASSQAPCLMQGQDSLVLDDGRGASVVQALTSGSPAGLIQDLASTPRAGFGYYSSYIASVMDIVRLMDSVHTAHYQYIPALVTERGAELSLLLNAAPSFYDPKSVLVVALPAIEPARPPSLRPVDPHQTYCAEKPDLVLPVEGAPLVFSTAFAHDMVLRVKAKDGATVDLPVSADAEKGGFVADTAGLGPGEFGDAIGGSLQGEWGFAPYSGPEFHLNTAPQHWQLAAGADSPLIAGHDADVHLEAPGAACVESIVLRLPSGKTMPVDWKLADPDQISAKAPLKSADAGDSTFMIKSYGRTTADAVPLQVFSPPGHLDSFTIHAGDLSAVLKGGGLDDVKDVALAGATFTPDPLTPASSGGELALTTKDVAAGELKPGETASAKVKLKDGRTLDLDVVVGAARPRVALIAKSVQLAASTTSSRIKIVGPEELPRGARLTFSIRAEAPANFSGDEKIEVATVNGAFSTVLTAASGLTLEDSQVALATLDTGAAFDAAAGGPLQFRIVDGSVAGNWLALTTLVRPPVLSGLTCPNGPGRACELRGSDLFLISSVSGNPRFDHGIQVPDGFTGDVLSVPHPVAGRLYMKLRDDPSVADTAVFPAKHRATLPKVVREVSSVPAAPAQAVKRSPAVR
jgi:hypothetical protein